MSHALSVATWNIHKGFSQFNRRMMVHELRERLRHLAPDILFLKDSSLPSTPPTSIAVCIPIRTA